MTGFSIQTEVFEGPLELLVQLIERRKLFVNDISLAEVADEYLEHVRELDTFPTADAAEFVVIASTLLLLKSKSLLPGLNLTTEEESDVDDLEHRLKLYKHFSIYAELLGKEFGVAMTFPTKGRAEEPVFAPHSSIHATALHDTLREVIERLPRKERLSQATVEKVVSLDEVIQGLTTRIQHAISMSFNEFSGNGKKEKKEVIVSFLAMLELVKQGMIFVEQRGDFDDIKMESKETSVPHYG